MICFGKVGKYFKVLRKKHHNETNSSANTFKTKDKNFEKEKHRTLESVFKTGKIDDPSVEKIKRN